ncbi:DUF6789 family protein [Halomarina ordinaria]|uniref:DUF6789 family protein n=1 Tax=Halomarina ordinaria TaxID=3033939 RepID=A0ABD5U9W5_9EURY|nr:DUF6789 family protein [Halomarina sp. PSRA2]
MADTSQEFDDPTLAEQVAEYDRLFGIVADGVIGAAGGLAGTALMTGVLFLAASVGAFSFASFASLTEPVGLSDVSSPVTVGYLIFLANGMVPWPLLFAALMEYLPGERPPVSGLFFGGALWTGFVMGFYSGFTGLTLVLYLGFTLAAHLVYGFALGLVFEYLSTRPDSLV